jgi:ATP-dependent protease ClpP protease subunit
VPSWPEVLLEIRKAGGPQDVVRRRYLRQLSRYTGRNTIIYYSGWLQKTDISNTAFLVNDSDKNGFMSAVHRLDRTKGLDLILHTPGGDLAATESIVDYLRSMFGNDIRAIVPQLAMSAGTMIALATKSVVMGRHSSIGPIDPQLMGIPAHGVIEEFQQAAKEIKADPSRAAVWQPIIAKYPPAFVGECQKAIAWGNDLVEDWLKTGMLLGDKSVTAKTTKIIKELADHALTKTHARHISAKAAAGLGIVVEKLEDDQRLQDLVLSLHHATVQTLQETGAVKIIENQRGTAFIQVIGRQVMV